MKFTTCISGVISRRKQRSAFDQVSEFDRGRIVAYRDSGLPFREIGSRVGRNQKTVMRIWDRWMQEGTTDLRGRSYPPQCNTSREDRQIVRMAVMDRSVTSRVIAQHIESVTHHSVSARTIRRRLQQSGLSARRPLLCLLLTQNHRRLRRQWCDERRMWVAEWNEIVFTDESRICLQHHDGGIRVWRHRGERMLNSCVMHRHTGPAPSIMVWGDIGYHSRTPLVRMAGTLNSQRYISEVLEPVVLLNLQGLVTAIFQHCQVIYSQFGLAIHQNDHQARRRFVEWAQNEIAVVPDFHKRILFSDEAHFWLNGYDNKQNCCIWSEANPQVYVETPLHPEKLTVWCALWAGGIIGPYFFKNDEGHNVTVNGDRYRAMITNFFTPELNNHDVQELQQDGATCHTARATIDLLKDTFGDRLISRFGPVNWPPRSCDLTPLDYFLWGYVKSLVYADKPQTLDHLEDNIRRVIADIRPQMLKKVIENWTSRLDYIRASRGSHMPEIIFKM
ncbi:transposable element Tcb1 transposase [Trichonephila clavipes]|nr:transposable element Tcb1 transposase [Trichonephila clavipes]